ncbi:hypothetical protein [Streptomyces sp. NPDC004014]
MTKSSIILLAVLLSLCVALGMALLRRAAKDSNAEAATFAVATFFTCFAALIPALAFLFSQG